MLSRGRLQKHSKAISSLNISEVTALYSKLLWTAQTLEARGCKRHFSFALQLKYQSSLSPSCKHRASYSFPGFWSSPRPPLQRHLLCLLSDCPNVDAHIHSLQKSASANLHH